MRRVRLSGAGSLHCVHADRQRQYYQRSRYGLLNSGFVYSPSSEGAIGSVDASVSDSTSAIAGISSYDVTSRHRFWLVRRRGVCQPRWHSGGVGLRSDQYGHGRRNRGLIPDFAGNAMQPGMVVSDDSITLPAFTQTIIYDKNVAFDLVAAPEPGSVVLCSGALAGLIGFGKTMRRTAPWRSLLCNCRS